ncbi:MAG: hypothetical protein P8J37_15005 [Fuerstiella sp.]|nr:hypothetical protein [Fuerstiella sp.]
MKRLSYILIALTLGFTPNQSSAQDASYSVAGDVSSPQSHRYPKGQQVHLRDLLDDAGYHSAAGVARILRGTPLQTVTTDSVTPEMDGRGSLLLPGDVVIFRSFDGYCPGNQNALAMFDSGPVLLQIPGGGLPARLLFEHNQIPADGRLSVTRTRNGQGSSSEVNLSLHEFIQHGDIVSLEKVAQTSALRTSRGFETIPGFAMARKNDAPNLNSIEDLEPGIEITAEENTAPPASLFSIPSVDTPSGEESQPPILTPSSTYSGQMLLQTDDPMLADAIGDDDLFRTVSLQTHSGSSASEASVPTAETEWASKTPNNAWNLIFITGLAMATGLIVFGWIKTKREQAAIHEFVDGLPDSHLDGNRFRNGANELVEVPTASEQNLQTLQQSVEISEGPGNFTVSVISGDCPILSAGLDEFETVAAQTFDAAPESPLSNAAYAHNVTEPPGNRTIDEAVMEIQASEWFEGTWLSSEASENSSRIRSASTRADPGEPATQIEAAATANSISQDNETFSDLEDLLQNRMPVDIKQADLPLRIALFGNPAGPRRLRIDAARTQIAPPRMMTSSEQKQQSKPAEATATASAPNRASSQSADVALTNADYDRFDRALDLLEGQSDL